MRKKVGGIVAQLTAHHPEASQETTDVFHIKVRKNWRISNHQFKPIKCLLALRCPRPYIVLLQKLSQWCGYLCKRRHKFHVVQCSKDETHMLLCIRRRWNIYDTLHIWLQWKNSITWNSMTIEFNVSGTSNALVCTECSVVHPKCVCVCITARRRPSCSWVLRPNTRMSPSMLTQPGIPSIKLSWRRYPDYAPVGNRTHDR